MIFEYEVKNQTDVFTSTIYSKQNTNTLSYDSFFASSTTSSLNTVLGSDVTPTVSQSSSVANEIGSSTNSLTNSYNYISSNLAVSSTLQQPTGSSNIMSASSTITKETRSSDMSNVQSTHSIFSQQGQLSSLLPSTDSLSRISTPCSSSVYSFTSPNFYSYETSSSSSPLTTSSPPTSLTDSEASSTSNRNLNSIQSPISSLMTYSTITNSQQQTSLSSFLQKPIWSTSEIPTSSESTTSSTDKSTAIVTPYNSPYSHFLSSTGKSTISQYSSYSSPIEQLKHTTKTLINSSKFTTTSYSSNKMSTLNPIKKISSSLSSSRILPSTTTTSKSTPTSSTSFSSSTSSYSSTSSSSSSSYQDYIIYTQEYYFTGKTTSFSTGIPITLTLPPSGTETNDHLSTTAVITAPMEVYNKWIDGGGLDPSDIGNNGNSNNSTGTNDRTIAGSVVGVVGGVILCGIIVWLMIFKRKKYNRSWNNKLGLDSDRKSKGMIDDPMSSSRSFSHTKGYRLNYSSTDNVESDPFKHEFEFDNRYAVNKAPPVPAPRINKTLSNKEYSRSEIPSTQSSQDNNDRSDYHLRFSYVSSETDSSFNSSAIGSYSTISSQPNRYRNMDDDKQGFLREIL